MKQPISWILEEYVFGTCALRDEIKRRKEAGEKHTVWNSMALRILFAFGIMISTALILICSIYCLLPVGKGEK